MLSILKGMYLMRKVPALGLTAAAMMALAGCTGGGGSTPTATASPSETAEAKVYSEDELRNMISGMTDEDGNELKLYSKEQVDQGGNIANLLMSTATVDPADCKDIATAGLLDTVESGEVAVAISEGERPRTLSAQSGSEGPDAVEVLDGISGKMGQCATFSVEALGQTYEVTSEELEADTKAEKSFATVSTRGGERQELMQVSAADGRLLVVATKSGTDLGDKDLKELEDLIDEVLEKAEGDDSPSGSASPTASPEGSASPDDSASPSPTESEDAGDDNPTGTPSPTS